MRQLALPRPRKASSTSTGGPMTSAWFLVGLLGTIASGIGTAASAVGTGLGTAATSAGGALSTAAKAVGGGAKGLIGHLLGGGSAGIEAPTPTASTVTPGGGIPSGPLQNMTPSAATPGIGPSTPPPGGGGFLSNLFSGMTNTDPTKAPTGAGGILGQLAQGQSPRGVLFNALTGTGGPFESMVSGLSPANRALLTAALSPRGRQRQMNVLGNLGSRFAGAPGLGGMSGQATG